MTKLAIYGLGGHGRMVEDVATLSGWNEISFYDDFSRSNRNKGPFEDLLLQLNKYEGVFVAIGNNIERKDRLTLLQKENANIISLIHPESTLSPSSQLGKGCVVAAGVIVNAHATIGHGVILNTASLVEHDCIVEDYVHIAPRASLLGTVNIGRLSMIGSCSVVKENTNIESEVVVGAGTVVLKDIQSKARVVGNPAREI